MGWVVLETFLASGKNVNVVWITMIVVYEWKFPRSRKACPWQRLNVCPRTNGRLSSCLYSMKTGDFRQYWAARIEISLSLWRLTDYEVNLAGPWWQGSLYRAANTRLCSQGRLIWWRKCSVTKQIWLDERCWWYAVEILTREWCFWLSGFLIWEIWIDQHVMVRCWLKIVHGTSA